jgi:RecA/RadA recombinase
MEIKMLGRINKMKKRDNILYINTGNTLLDLVVGGAPNVLGYPVGKFVNIVGDKSAGKTFLANEMIAYAYHNFDKKKFKWIYDDCEAGYSFDTVSM